MFFCFIFLLFLFQEIICDVITSLAHCPEFLDFIPLIPTAFSLHTAFSKKRKKKLKQAQKKEKTKRNK